MRHKLSFLIVSFVLSILSVNLYAATDNFSKISNSIQSFKVEPFLGASSTAIPITVPPGRKGIQPNINASYSSAYGNGWLGVGWTLDFGYIERSTRNGIPKYDSTDKFYLSFMGINSDLETSSATPNEYYPKSTAFFIKLLFKDSRWEAYDKEGRKYIFGATSDSRIWTPKGTYRWALNKVIDTAGNYMIIVYFQDGYHIYPQRIEYTGNESTSELPTHKVEFILENRDDVSSNYRSGYSITTTKRLKEIKTYVKNSLANRYLFEYTYSKQTNRSLLTKFTTFGSDGLTNLPPMTFSYQDLNPNNYRIVYIDPNTGNKLWCIKKNFGMFFGNTTGILYPRGSFEGGGQIFWETVPTIQKSGSYWSIDGKGRLTVNLPKETAFYAWTYVYVETAKTISLPILSNGNFFCWLNADYSKPINPQQIDLKPGPNLLEITCYKTEAGFNFDLNYPLADNVTRMHSNQFIIPQLAGDFNGDGLTDLATYYASNGYIKVGLSNKDGFKPAEYWTISPKGSGFPKYMGAEGLSLLLGDFNADTLTDIRAINSNMQSELIVSTTGNSFRDEGGGGSAKFPVKGNPFAADFNGDGVTDVGLQVKDTNDVLIAPCRAPYHMDKSTSWLSGFAGKILPGDFNGDGFIDIAAYDASQQKLTVALNKGSAFDIPKTWISGFSPSSEPTSVDCNGDGLTDIAYYDRPNGQVFVAVSCGYKFLAPAKFLSGFKLKDPDVVLQASDFNGDSVSDFYLFNPYTQKTEIAYSASFSADLLIKVKNGIGSEICIKYGGSGNYDNTITKSLQSEYEYKNLSGQGLPFSVPLVKETVVSDGMGNSYVTLYSYKGGFYDRFCREFRGFGYISIIDAEKNQKEIYFKQDDIYKGRPYCEEYRDPSGKLFLKIGNIWSYQSMANDCIYPYPQVGKFVYLAKQERLTYDGDESFKKSYTAYSWSFGVNEQCVKGDLIEVEEGGDGINPSKERRISYVRSGGENILSRPSYTYLFSSHVFAKKWLYYDNSSDFNALPTKGLLTKEKICVASSDPSPNDDKDPANAMITTYAYDAYGNPISVTDPENHTTTTAYDLAYHIYPVEAKNALGQISKSTYEPKTGQILTATDANNQTTNYVYDVLGRLTKVIGPNDTAQYPGVIYEYDFSSRPIKVTKKFKTVYPSTYSVEYSFYDGLGGLIETKIDAENDPISGQPRQIVKDAVKLNQQGGIKEKFNPYFVATSSTYSLPEVSIPKTTFEYDCLGRLTKVTNPDFTSRAIQYSDWTQTKTDENGHQSRSTYDALNRLVKQEEFNSGQTYMTKYEYDIIENDSDFNLSRKIFKITDNNGNITKIFSDLADRKVKMSDPDMGVWFYTYDRAGNLKKQKDAKNQIISFEYDALNRLTKRLYPDGKFITYYYDDKGKSYCKGRLSYVVDLAGRTDYYYDNLGRQIKMTKTIDKTSYSIERTYNADNQVASLKYPDGEVVTYAYNKANSIEKITGVVTYVGNIDYAPSGQMAKINYGNGASTDYMYDPQTLRLTDLRTNNGNLQNLHYRYDNVGNIVDITDYRNTATQTFQYDDLNRLIQAVGSYGSFSYQYDPLGNMVYKEGVSYTYGKTGSKPHTVISGSNGFSATYDANGNMISGKNKTFTYDTENRLLKFNESGKITSFAYDSDGERVKKTANGTTTLYIDELFEKTGSLITKHIYLGATRIASKTSTQTLYYHPDHLGSSNVITNASGAKVQLSEYKPYGEFSKNTAKLTNYYFTGKELDSTGLYYYGARYYDPRIGRFITPDPVNQNLYDPQNLNSYSYCRNNPLNLIDPTGESWKEWWNSWSNYVTTDYFMRSVAGFTLGVTNSIWNLPRGIWNTVAHPIVTISSIPTALQEIKQGLLSPDIFTYSYTIGNITGTIETSLAMGYGIKAIKSNLAGRVPMLELDLKGALSNKVIRSFSGRIHEITLKSDVKAYRYWGGVSDKPGHWLTTASTITKIKSTGITPNVALNLPAGATAENLSSFIISKGTKIFVGRVKDGASWATQIWVEEPNVIVPLE